MATMYDNGQPDLVVAVDFGMTCTGVAYANLTTRSNQVYFIQKWPGRAQASENKVPTSVVYSLPDRSPIAWGFASDAAYENSQGAEYKEWFKILLDPAELRRDQELDPEGAPKSMAEVEAFYEDYLRLLYNHIESELSLQLYGKKWEDARIEFIFSLPTTWTDKSIVERYRSIIFRAGFSSSPGHTVDIGLTEAEAAAVQVSKRDQGVFHLGDIILVCDAGGGTTDLSILQVAGMVNDVLSLRQLDVVQGRTIGSASIDADFERLARQTLQIARQTEPFDMADNVLHELSWAMMKSSDYQNMKCEFGSKASQYFRTFTVPAKKLPPTYVNEQSGISDQSVMFQRSDFQELFDKQLRKLFSLIDHQLECVEQKLPGERITHLVLSGGLGNSPYVLQQLKARYEMGATTKFPSTEWLQVRAAPEPQLAVCKGIVEDRVQKLSSGQAVLGWRCCRESYGVACKERFNSANPSHANRQTAIDQADGKLYVVDGVDWFIKAGDPVSTDHPIVHNFFRTIPENDPVRTFSTPIFVSRGQNTRNIPNYLAPGADIYQLCNVESNLSSFSVDQFEQRGRQPFGRRRPHYIVRYQIKAIIGPGDLRFELWFNGKKVNVDHAINVEWFAAPEPRRESMASSQGEAPLAPPQRQPQQQQVYQLQSHSRPQSLFHTNSQGSSNAEPPLQPAPLFHSRSDSQIQSIDQPLPYMHAPEPQYQTPNALQPFPPTPSSQHSSLNLTPQPQAQYPHGYPSPPHSYPSTPSPQTNSPPTHFQFQSFPPSQPQMPQQQQQQQTFTDLPLLPYPLPNQPQHVQFPNQFPPRPQLQPQQPQPGLPNPAAPGNSGPKFSSAGWRTEFSKLKGDLSGLNLGTQRRQSMTPRQQQVSQWKP